MRNQTAPKAGQGIHGLVTRMWTDPPERTDPPGTTETGTYHPVAEKTELTGPRGNLAVRTDRTGEKVASGEEAAEVDVAHAEVAAEEGSGDPQE